jgi:hypothetical protein
MGQLAPRYATAVLFFAMGENIKVAVGRCR